MTRGELWTVAGGVYAAKPRPALILQDDAYSQTGSLTVAPLTGHLVEAPLLRIRVPAGGLTGLECESDIMIDKLTTVRRSNVVSRVGRLGTEQLISVERAVMAFLGLAR